MRSHYSTIGDANCVGTDTRMRVSEDDLRFYDVSSIPLADGSGYAAEFGVFHELHCLVGCQNVLHMPISFTDYQA